MTYQLARKSGERLPRLAPAITNFQERLLVLMVEVEQPEGLSSRKIIVETMKHNVVTAYSGEEALYLAQRSEFDVVFVHSLMEDIGCGELIRQLRALLPDARYVAITPDDVTCGADEAVDSFRPDQLAALFHRIHLRKSPEDAVQVSGKA